jgi:hypothetical protein
MPPVGASVIASEQAPAPLFTCGVVESAPVVKLERDFTE